MGLEELPYFADKSVLAIQKQAYEDGLRDAAEMVRNAVTVLRLPEVATYIGDDRPAVRSAALGIADAIEAMLTASQKPRCELCNYQHGHAIGCANNPVDVALKAASQKEPQ